jgi:hypothetical protein
MGVVAELVLFGFIAYPVARTAAVDHFGTQIGGVVSNLSQWRNNKQKTFYQVDYQYTVGGVWYTGQTRVSPTTFAQVQPGQIVEVRALSALPTWGVRPVLPGFDPWRELMVPTAALLTMGLLLALALAYLSHSQRLSRDLVRIGCPTSGLVTDKKTYSGKGTDHILFYRFLTDEADAVAQRIPRIGQETVPKDRYDAIAVGDLLTILYDPRQPNRNLVYDFADHQAVL